MPRYQDLALGAGAVLVVGLGLVALKPDTLPSPTEGADDALSSTLPSPLRPRASSTPTPSASATREGAGAKTGSWVVGAGSDLVFFAPRRGCDGAGSVEVRVARGGASSTYAVKGLTAVGGIEVEAGDTAVLVGVDAACKGVGFRTTDAGKTWKELGRLPEIWSLVPGADRQVHAPGGAVEVPCEPLAVTGLDDRVARLACTDGRLLGTVSGGDDWSILGNNRNVKAVGFVAATTALALVEDPSCAGIRVERSTDGGTGFKPAYCVEGDGPWGLFTDADRAVVVGGDSVARSTDDGATWAVQRLRP
ncbi:hypothetical protein [Nocardioides sp.]|uniref:WD40/YVTN/BNR-like repeat-containing protein n=1 Tax=Nocardioides sp. TaxID=35761 RepID=UPI002C3A786D|nr:hypothetical protein [Nocardioides sp.]HSX68649.1 hypothetical protein [Nocardioides sp.]